MHLYSCVDSVHWTVVHIRGMIAASGDEALVQQFMSISVKLSATVLVLQYCSCQEVRPLCNKPGGCFLMSRRVLP